MTFFSLYFFTSSFIVVALSELAIANQDVAVPDAICTPLASWMPSEREGNDG